MVETTRRDITRQWPKLRALIFDNKDKKPFSFYCSLLKAFYEGELDDLGAILFIVEIMVVVSLSTAGVERGWSTYNLIVTVLRNKMLETTKEKLMHISSASASVCDFDASKVLSYWKSVSREKIHLFGNPVPSIHNVNERELALKQGKAVGES